jgi:ABC-type ATPase involved in cell division
MATHDSNIVNALNKRVITFQDKKIVSDVEKGKYNLK